MTEENQNTTDLRKPYPEEERKIITEIFTQISKARKIIVDNGNRHDITLMFAPTNHQADVNGFFELHGLVWTFVDGESDPKTGLFDCSDPTHAITQANVVIRINNTDSELSGMRSMIVDITQPNHTYTITFNNAATAEDISNYVFEPIINNSIRVYKQSK